MAFYYFQLTWETKNSRTVKCNEKTTTMKYVYWLCTMSLSLRSIFYFSDRVGDGGSYGHNEDGQSGEAAASGAAAAAPAPPVALAAAGVAMTGGGIGNQHERRLGWWRRGLLRIRRVIYTYVANDRLKKRNVLTFVDNEKCPCMIQC